METLTFDKIKVGMVAETTRIITTDIIDKFAEVSGDFNPVHMNSDFAAKTIFKERIAHGLLSASFISAVLANKLPGPGSIYLKQDLVFKKPVRIGDNITTKVEVVEKDYEKERIHMKTTCMNQNGELVIDGKALIMVMKI